MPTHLLSAQNKFAVIKDIFPHSVSSCSYHVLCVAPPWCLLNKHCHISNRDSDNHITAVVDKLAVLWDM